MRRNKTKLYLHLVWTTWDRLDLIDEAIEREVYRSLSGTCLEIGCMPLAIGGTTDHVHVLMMHPTTITIAEIVQKLKGSASRYVNEQVRPGAFFKWQGHYGAFTVSPHEKEKVRSYIDNQKKHHADNTLWPSAEESSELCEHKPERTEEELPAQAGKRP